MRILNLVSAKIWGGGEQYVYDVCREMTERNIENYVLVDCSNTFLKERFSQVSNVLTARLYSVNGMTSLRDILDIIDEQKIDIINCHSGKMMPLCLILKKFRDVKIVLFKHNIGKVKNDFYHQYMRKNTDAIICVSNLVYNLQIESLSEAVKKKYHVVYNGISVNRFNKYTYVNRNKDKFIVGYAGRITENKGIGILLEAIKKLHKFHSDIEFNFVGAVEEDYLNKLQKEINSNNMARYVRYGGLETDMEKFYKSVDVLVLPSIVREAFGLVICEAMYCGIPVITSNSGAQAEIIEDGVDGLILDDVNADTLITKILYVYNSKDTYRNMINNAKIKVERRFNIRETVNCLMKIYQTLL